MTSQPTPPTTSRAMTAFDVSRLNPQWHITTTSPHAPLCATYHGTGYGHHHVCANTPEELHHEILAADTRRPALIPTTP